MRNEKLDSLVNGRPAGLKIQQKSDIKSQENDFEYDFERFCGKACEHRLINNYIASQRSDHRIDVIDAIDLID